MRVSFPARRTLGLWQRFDREVVVVLVIAPTGVLLFANPAGSHLTKRNCGYCDCYYCYYFYYDYWYDDYCYYCSMMLGLLRMLLLTSLYLLADLLVWA